MRRGTIAGDVQYRFSKSETVDVSRVSSVGEDGVKIRHAASGETFEDALSAISDVVAVCQSLYQEPDAFETPEFVEGELRMLSTGDVISYRVEGEWLRAAHAGDLDPENLLTRVVEKADGISVSEGES